MRFYKLAFQNLSHSSLCKIVSLFLGDFSAVDLLEKMLVLDTDKRITAAEALAHAYFAQYHDPDDEPVADPYDQSFESRELEIEEWKSESGEQERANLNSCVVHSMSCSLTKPW